jgi:uncharacterized protein YcbK (DUF882 family)
MIYDGQITKNFNIKEFACKDNGEILLNADTLAHIQRLQRFRDWYMRPMHINSAYRTEAYNTSVGGSPTSQHLLGLASDIALPSEFYGFGSARKEEFLQHVKDKWLDLCAADGLGGGCGIYNTFVHLDSRLGPTSTWDYR